MNLLFAINAGYIPVFRECLRSVCKNGGADHYSVWILQSDFEEKDRKDIEETFETVDFHFVDVDLSLFEGFPTSSRYPVQIFFRLAAPVLIKEDIDRILYLDGDTLVINPLQELYDTDFEGNLVAACSHTSDVMDYINKVRLGMSEVTPYINSGVMLMNIPELRKTLSLDDIQNYAHTHELALFLPDQDILTALYGTRIKQMDSWKWNLGNIHFTSPELGLLSKEKRLEWVRQNTSIIHYYGSSKPWKPGYHMPLGIFYDEIVRHTDLWLVIDPNEAKSMLKEIPNTILIDANALMQVHPMITDSEANKLRIVSLAELIQNYIDSPVYKTILFYPGSMENAQVKEIFERLSLTNCSLFTQTETTRQTQQKAEEQA